MLVFENLINGHLGLVRVSMNVKREKWLNGISMHSEAPPVYCWATRLVCWGMAGSNTENTNVGQVRR